MSETILGILDRQAAATPDKTAIHAIGREPLTYARLRDQIAYVVEALNSAGVGRNDRVAMVLPHGPELATASLGVIAGAVAMPLNPEYRQAEYASYLSSMKPALLLAEAGRDSPARSAAAELRIPVIELKAEHQSAAGIFSLTIDRPPSRAVNGGMAEADDAALVLHTSGTTARSRTVPLTQRNLVASVNHLTTSLQLTAGDRCLHMLPLFHIGGIVDVLAAPLATGGTVVCTSGFSTPEFYNCLDTFSPTWTQAVPAMIGEILAYTDEHREKLAHHSLRFLRSVSAPLPVALMESFERIFGVPVIEIYGMTETTGLITSNPLPDAIRKPGSVGLPAGPEVRIVDESGAPLDAGHAGEVVVRGPNVMTGYEGAPGCNNGVFFDSWFRTGDQGHLDEDGYLFLTGRIKEIINRGGEKISPWEVDEVVRSHPAVADAATFALPHDSLGEEIAVAVVPGRGKEVSRQELIGYIGTRLSYFKVPRHVYFVERIPRTAGGKLRRIGLAQSLGVSRENVARRGPPSVMPQSVIEKTLAGSWEHILKVDSIGIHDNFFDLGGDSLKAASFVNELERQWGETIYVSAVFDAPTIADFEHYIKRHHPELVARILGRSIGRRDDYEDRLDDEKIAAFRRLIVRTTGNCTPPPEKNRPAAFILSPPRSGSTLLRAILAGHSRLFSPPELYLLSFDNLADRNAWFTGSQRFQLEGNLRSIMQVKGCDLEQARALVERLERRRSPTWEYYHMVQEWLDGRLLIDKTPYYASRVETLERAEEYFEEPLYIHLLRHPYGMIRSFEEAGLEQLWYPRLVGVDAARTMPCPLNRRELAEVIWLVLHQNIMSFLERIPKQRLYSLKFEDLVAEPRRTVRELCEFLGVEPEEAMLRPHEDKRQRMTDGVHSVSRMIGDVKFHQHTRIDAAVADLWKDHYKADFLADETWQMAKALGYDLSVAGLKQRTEFEV